MDHVRGTLHVQKASAGLDTMIVIALDGHGLIWAAKVMTCTNPRPRASFRVIALSDFDTRSTNASEAYGE